MQSHIVVLIQTISLKTIKHLVFVMEAQSVFCQVRSDSTDIHVQLHSDAPVSCVLNSTFIWPFSLC